MFRRQWIILLLGSVLCACSGTESDFETVESPDGRYRLVVTVTVPALPHARHIVSAYIEPASGQERGKLVETKLANDGVPFTSHNIGIRWTGQTTALVCLRPTDRADRSIHINVAGAPSAEIRPGC